MNKKKKARSGRRTFRRSWPATILGLGHITTGFITAIWAGIRIYLFDPGAVFQHGWFYGIYNYLFEFTSVLLWVSGILLLRGSRWGWPVARIWAGAAVFFWVSARIIRSAYWGDLAPAPGWGETVFFLYAVALAGYDLPWRVWVGRAAILAFILNLPEQARTRWKGLAPGTSSPEPVDLPAPGEAPPVAAAANTALPPAGDEPVLRPALAVSSGESGGEIKEPENAASAVAPPQGDPAK